ncbi:hypothetical protein JTB14_011979 [Gonioctena quinquepunctata]|nr:hypothetical protein JTB14_011979 [Gonioctena quinquepunctata]
MLILFHCLSFLIYQLLRHRKRIKLLETIEKNKENSLPELGELDLENTIKFDPPVFRQRYGKIYETLLDERWRTKIKKLCDFGCAEFGLFVFIKRLSSLNEIFCIDIDEDTLRYHSRKIQPLTIEYLKRREEPLQVTVFAGSVADPDYRLRDTDAVVAIELVEHLYPDVLDAFPYNVFCFIEPKIAIVTTPNADFNVLFSSDSKRMRHYDHKFEWDRAQFEEWATNIVSRFPDYTVSFSGIGEGPSGTEHLGGCSQMAVFVRKDLLHNSYVSKSCSSRCFCDNESFCKGVTASTKMSCNCVCALCSPNKSVGVCTYYSYSKQIIDYEIQGNQEDNPSYDIYYKLIEKVDFPFERDDRTEEQKMIEEFQRNRSEIPLTDLLYGPDGAFITESELSHLLTRHGYCIEKCIIQETGQLESCVVYEPEMEEFSGSSEASDWDDPYIEKESDENYESSAEISSPKVTEAETSNSSESQSRKDKNKKPSNPLIDSGYQKSCYISPKTSVDSEETDVFEEITGSPHSTRGFKKKSVNSEKPTSVSMLSSSDSGKGGISSRRIEELDKIDDIPTSRAFLNNFLNPMAQYIKNPKVKNRDNLAGPSNFVPENKKKGYGLAPKPIDDGVPGLVLAVGNLHKNGRNEDLRSSEISPVEIESMIKTIPLMGVPIYKNSSADDTPQFPVEDLEETDAFESITTTPKLSSEDNKVHLKKLTNLDKNAFAPITTLPTHGKFKLDTNRINELDKFHNIPPGRTFFNHFLGPPHCHLNKKSTVRDRDCLPGPSNVAPKKRRRVKKAGSLTDLDDLSPVDDMKSLTNCIVENSLNKLNIQEAEKSKDDLIEFNSEPKPVPIPMVEVQEDVINVVPSMEIEEVEDEKIENGLETENLGANKEIFPTQPDLDDSVHRAYPLEFEDPDMFSERRTDEEMASSSGQQTESQIAHASREALFDPNSVQDLLEDFEIPPPMQEAVDILGLGSNVILLGIHSMANVLSVENGFPHWLLQILGTQVVQEGSVTSANSEEPHYYCQGDGLGVHPSILAVEVEEEEDEDTTDSSNNSVDFAEVDQGVSTQDMTSLPDDPPTIAETQDISQETEDGGLRNEASEQTEYFDTVSSSSDTGLGTSTSKSA